MKTKLLFFDLLACIISLIVCVFTANKYETLNTIDFTMLCITFFAPIVAVFYKSFKEYGI